MSSPFIKTGILAVSLITIFIPSFTLAAGWAPLNVTEIDSTYYRSVSAVSDTVLAFGSYGSVKSTDGGLTWGSEVPYSTSSSPTMQTGIAFGSSAVATGINGDISLSLDLGNSWTSIRSPLSEDINAIAKYHASSFPSSYTLYAAGANGAIMKSIDGGMVWTDISTTGTDTFNAVGVASPTTAWVAGDNGALYKTTNGGTSWIAENPSTSFDINTISVIDETHVWIGGEGEFLAYTSDGGISWTHVTPTDKHIIGEINSLVFLNATEGFMARGGRCMWNTVDGGATWATENENCGTEYNMLTASSNDQLYTIGHTDTERILSAYDEQSPTVGIVSTNQTTAGTSGMLTVTAEDNFAIASCTAYAGGLSLGSFIQYGNTSTFTLSYSFSTSGSKVLSATCVDSAGNSTTGTSTTITISADTTTNTAHAGDLVKTACAAYHDVNDPCVAVYYLGSDGKRHAFTNEKVFFSWYSDFNDVVTISNEAMASYIIGDNVTYKPGITLVKFLTVRTVYAVEQGGILHGVGSEAIAASLYGSDWNTQDVDDISDAFYGDYSIGSAINTASDYSVSAALASTTTIDDNF